MNRFSICQRSKKNVVNKQLYLRVTKDELAEIEAFASAELLSRSSFLRMLVLQGIRQYGVI